MCCRDLGRFRCYWPLRYSSSLGANCCPTAAILLNRLSPLFGGGSKIFRLATCDVGSVEQERTRWVLWLSWGGGDRERGDVVVIELSTFNGAVSAFAATLLVITFARFVCGYRVRFSPLTTSSGFPPFVLIASCVHQRSVCTVLRCFPSKGDRSVHFLFLHDEG